MPLGSVITLDPTTREGGGAIRPPNRQNCVKTKITKSPMDFVNLPQPTLPRVSFKVAEEANTGGATNEQYLYKDQNYKKTTITKLPTDFVKILKPTLL